MDNKITAVWPGWETVRVIGHGSFGTVYEIQRNVTGDMEKAALKHITIPATEDEIVNLQSEGMDAASITRTFQDQLNDILNEYKLMRKLNDCPYVVHCDDVMYNQKQAGVGWDVLIKMELLTPITKVLSNKAEISEEKVISLGKDISRALIRCAEHNILHRDIKIQNIFVSDSGQYKLGDFGIAKAKERTSTGTARIGTYDYMAPEIYFGKRYDKTADIYSLGMVMYWLLNNRKMPFLLQTEEAPRVQERENARMRRLNGEKLPPPVNGSKGLQKIVLKCCAYRAQDRYANAGELLDDLTMLSARHGIRKSGRRRTGGKLHRFVPALIVSLLLVWGILAWTNLPGRSGENTEVPQEQTLETSPLSTVETVLSASSEPEPSPIPTVQPTLSPISTVQPTPSPITTTRPTQSPLPAVTSAPPSMKPNLPLVTKNPTDETVYAYGESQFITRYENADLAEWFFISPDGSLDISYQRMQDVFPSLEIIGGNTKDLTLRNIPIELNGCKVYCRFSNSAGSVDTEPACLTVLGF